MAFLQARLGRFRASLCVNNIQTTDCQRFKNIAKFAHLRPSGLSVANIASTEAENEQIV